MERCNACFSVCICARIDLELSRAARCIDRHGCFSVSCVFSAVFKETPLIVSPAALDIKSGMYNQTYRWWTGYSSSHPQNETTADELWDRIVPAHGVVAVDRQWAAQKQLPDTISLPGDPSKGVYIIDAYHQLHCLVCSKLTPFPAGVAHDFRLLFAKPFINLNADNL